MKIKSFGAVLIAAFSSLISYGQDIIDYIDAVHDDIKSQPFDNRYSHPTTTETRQWEDMLEALFHNPLSNNASSIASGLGYSISRYNDVDDKEYTIIERNSSGPHWGTYVIDFKPQRNLVIQSPHPENELGTAEEGIYLFKHSGARMYMLAGTSRCNHSSFGGCAGSTSVCNVSSEDFRISDMAHTDQSIFHITSEWVAQNDPISKYFINLHGFDWGSPSRGGNNSDYPYAIISNGTQNDPVSTWDPLPEFGVHLSDALGSGKNTKVVHKDPAWSELRGFTNTTGRMLNGSTNACTGANMATPSARFIHLEQEKDELRKNAIGWDKVLDAIVSTFPCFSLSNGTLYALSEFTHFHSVSIEGMSSPNNTENDLYSNFHGTGAMVEADSWGRLLTFTLEKNPAFGGNHTIAVWIDLNENGIFEPLEVVGSTYENLPYRRYYTSNVRIAAGMGAPLGKKMLRIGVYKGYFHPFQIDDLCSSNKFGEIEDYEIEVVPGISNVASTNRNVILHPNPSKEKEEVSIELANEDRDETVRVDIYNMVGVMIKSEVKAMRDKNINLQVSGLLRGRYLVIITKPNGEAIHDYLIVE